MLISLVLEEGHIYLVSLNSVSYDSPPPPPPNDKNSPTYILRRYLCMVLKPKKLVPLIES